MKYIVGESYDLPCVFLSNIWFVVLHRHVGDISGEEHLHLDLRFVSDDDLKKIEMRRDQILACGVVPVSIRSMVCCSSYVPIKHFAGESRSKFLKLQRANAKNKMMCGVCPHQGCNLDFVDPVRIGKHKDALVCPCHGLTWSGETGNMIRRVPKVTQ